MGESRRYAVNETVDVKLPVSGEVVKVRRMTWGERLEVDSVASAGTRDGQIRDARRFRQVLIQYATKSAPDKDDGMSEGRFFSMDPTDGFTLVEEVSKINLIDHPAFLRRLEQETPKTDTSEA